MAMSLRTNISSLQAQADLSRTSVEITQSLAKLSSGFRITKAQDDAAGLAIAVNLGAQIKSYNQSVRNANDAHQRRADRRQRRSTRSQNILTRLRELASQSASSGVSNTERGYIQNEVDGLISEIDRIANATEYNGVSLLNTNARADLPGRHPQRRRQRPDRRHHQQRDGRQRCRSGGVVLSTLTGAARRRWASIDTAMQSVSSTRATLGAQGNRMEKAIRRGDPGRGQPVGRREPHPRRRCRRGDLEHEPQQILMQAGVAVLAQANQMSSLVLKLLR